MGMFAFERARRLARGAAATENVAALPDELTGVKLYNALKKRAKELAIDVPTGTKSDELKLLIEAAEKKAGELDG